MRITLPNNWQPRWYQENLWDYVYNGLLNDVKGMRAVEVAHRRWGKDDIALHTAAVASHINIGNYWHMLPEYKQGRKAIWDAVNPRTGKRRIDEAFPKSLRATTREQEMMIKFKNGSTWQIVGSDNYDMYVGSTPIGVTQSEYALSNPKAWGYISPILEENGGWAIFIYTARPVEHAKRLFEIAKTTPGWFAEKQTAYQTDVFTKEQLDQIRLEYIAMYGDIEGEAMFSQEYLCEFSGTFTGSYYSKQIGLARKEGRITSVPHNTGSEVHTFWDLGVDDYMTIWFLQVIGKEYHWIDYYENNGEAFDHYAKVLKEKRYTYGNHYMPHDIANRELSATSAYGGAMSRKEAAESLGIYPIIKVKRPDNIKVKIECIGRVRNIFSQFWFDEAKCSKGLQALEFYHQEYDEKQRKFRDYPAHDWSSHAASAMQTFILGYVPKPKTNGFYLEDTPQGEWA